MKIVFSPSKGMKLNKISCEEFQGKPKYAKESEILIEKLRSYTKSELGDLMKIKGELLDEVYKYYHSNVVEACAIEWYNGVSFRALEVGNYREKDLKYMSEHLLIFSALYGLVKPFDRITPYRLDMTMKVLDKNPYEYWKVPINENFIKGELVINLASSEFSKLLSRTKLNVVDIEFRQQRDTGLKNISTEAKKARGAMLNHMIKNSIETIEELKDIAFNGYSYREQMSTANKLTFVQVL